MRRSDWDRNANRNRDVLERIVALLVALAGLADRAASLPAHRRQHVLGILMRGEAAARAFVIGTGGDEPGGDAARLASRFQALARMLCAVLARLFVLPGAAGRQAGRYRPAGVVGPRHPAAPPAPDTS